jgi:hypothetical protein
VLGAKKVLEATEILLIFPAGRMLFRYQILCFKNAERDAFRNSPISPFLLS